METLISYKTAKLAKIKGFNEPTDLMYGNQNKPQPEKYNLNVLKYYDLTLAPTQTSLKKWFSNDFDIEITVDRDVSVVDKKSYVVKVCDFSKATTDEQIMGGQILIVPHIHFDGYKDYESALEKGLEEALEMI